MKKLTALFSAALAAAFAAAPAFAQLDLRFSAGGGAIFNTHWSDAAVRPEFGAFQGQDMRPPHGVMGPTEQTQSAMRQGLFDTREFTAGGGVFGFFDAASAGRLGLGAALGVGLVFNNVRHTVAIPDLSGTINPNLAGEETHNFRFTQLNLSLLLRYPFEVAPRWSVFPMLGIDGQIALGDYDDAMRANFQEIANMGYEMPNLGEFWNAIWIRFGAGADFALRGSLFLRTEALYGFKLNSRYESRMADYWEPNLRGMSNGLHVRLALGYTFR
jgi:hypothetical protein